LLAVALFALGQYYFLKEKALIFYAVFCLSNALFFLRSLENLTGWAILFTYLGDMMCYEAPFAYISYAAYVLFFHAFTSVAMRQQFLSQLLLFMAKLTLVVFIIDIVLQVFFSLKTSLTFLEYGRFVFFLVLVYALYFVFFKMRTKAGNWLGFGTLIVVLGALLSNAENLFNGYQHPFWGGAMRQIEFKNFSVYFYDMKTALLFEVFCFYIALHLKMRADKDERLALAQRTSELSAQVSDNQQLIKELEQLNSLHNTQLDPTNPFLLRGVKFIEDNLSNPHFSVEQLAEHLNMTRAAFSTKWKKESQETPLETIRRMRLARASDLLLSTTLTISEIAYQTGFNELAHFTRVFTAQLGKSPSEFRKNGN
jgi:AraC-like DNA-binding protein